MTELSGYRPDQTPQGDLNENRFVFVDPNDRHGREFNITAAAAAQGRPIGGDTSEVNAMVEAAYREAEAAREEAATHTPEAALDDKEYPDLILKTGHSIVSYRYSAEGKAGRS